MFGGHGHSHDGGGGCNHSHSSGHGHSHGRGAMHVPGALNWGSLHPPIPLPSAMSGQDPNNLRPYPVDPRYLKGAIGTGAPNVPQTSENVEEYADWDCIKSVQYGALPRVMELVEGGLYDVNQAEEDGVTLLHWAAINNRLEIMRYLVARGATVDRAGGLLGGTPLHWAMRQGHLPAVVLLLTLGADMTLQDKEGYAMLHLGAKFGFTHIVAYLLAKGADVDLRDATGRTALMHCCSNVLHPDCTRVLLKFGASMHLKEREKGNTAGHLAAEVGNSMALLALERKTFDWTILNDEGQTVYQILLAKGATFLAKRVKEAMIERGLDNGSRGRRWPFKFINEDVRKRVMFIVPAIALALCGTIFHIGASYYIKALLIVAFFLTLRFAVTPNFFDRRMNNVVPFGVSLATLIMVASTHIFVSMPLQVWYWQVAFLLTLSILIYVNIRCILQDPGTVPAKREDQVGAILRMSELPGFHSDRFCVSCMIIKPLRSKHCDTCDRCVARFDHHCPWVYNCVGAGNLHLFVGYLAALLPPLGLSIAGIIEYWHSPVSVCAGASVAKLGWFGFIGQVSTCHTWLFYCFCHAICYVVFVSSLLVNMLIQTIYLNKTTNERMNSYRYKHFQTPDGGSVNPFNRGLYNNAREYFGRQVIDWTKIYSLHDLAFATGQLLQQEQV